MVAGVFPQGHALLVGVGSYAHLPAWDVPPTARDAAALAGVLQDGGRCGYPERQIRLLEGPAAGKDGILGALQSLARTLQEGDTLLFFYAGHGQYDTNGRYCLSAHDTQADENGKIRPGSGLDEDELLGALRALPARRLLALVNACFSGALSAGLGPPPAWPQASLSGPLVHKILGSGQGRILITACREEQRSYFELGGKGLTYFGQAVVDGLSGKAKPAPGSGVISAYGLYNYVYQAVYAATGEKQEPELTVQQGVGPFPAALYRGGGSLGDFDPGEALPETPAVRQLNPARVQQTIQSAGRDQVNIAGPLILGNFQGQYTQGNRIEIQDRSVNIHAPVHGSVISTGDGNVVNQAPSLEAFTALLGRIQAALPASGLPADELAEAQEDLTRVQTQAASPAPNRGLLLKRLDSLVNFLANSATIAASAPQLAQMASQALAWAQALFRAGG